MMMATMRSSLRATRRLAKTRILRTKMLATKEEEPKDNDDGHKEEDRKPERALPWLQNGEDPEPNTMRQCCLKVHWRCRRSLRIPRARARRSI